MLSGFQVIFVIFLCYIFYNLYNKYKQRKLNIKEIIWWLFFWIVVFILVIKPETTSFLANKLGIGRGVDLAVYAAILIIFYLLFKLFIKFQTLNKQITILVRNISILKARQENNNEIKHQTNNSQDY